jgi:hypothetical protein
MNFVWIRRDPLTHLERLRHQYGDFVAFKMGGQNLYFASHPDVIRDVSSPHNSNFVKGRALQRAKRSAGTGTADQ